jgi:8-oxo-dGTP diphosphatase
MSPQSIGACILVLNPKQTHILLGKRKNAYKAGWYGVPGGRIEIGEKIEGTVRRELMEETNLDAVEFQYVGVIKEHQGEYDFVHFAYVCTKFGGELQVSEPDKCEAWEWFPLNNLPKDILPGHKAAVDMFVHPEKGTLRDI